MQSCDSRAVSASVINASWDRRADVEYDLDPFGADGLISS